MDVVLLVKAAVMGVVEGLTEFLPISSTGHLILAGALLGFDDEKAKVFDIAIQTGAILAVILVYWQKIRSTLRRAADRARGPALRAQRAGRLHARPWCWACCSARRSRQHLFTPAVVASTFILGGFVILWAEKRGTQSRVRIHEVDEMAGRTRSRSAWCSAWRMIPGTSRSGATIIGGMLLGLSRKAATDFSFYLAIPTLIGAGAYSLYKERALLSAGRPADVRAWAWCSRSSAPGCACAGCCATSPPTASRPSPGTASPSASWCWRLPGPAGWSGQPERRALRAVGPPLAFGLRQPVGDDAQHLRVGHHAQVAGVDLDVLRALALLLACSRASETMPSLLL